MAVTEYPVATPTPSAGNVTTLAAAVTTAVPIGDVVYVAVSLGAASPSTGVSDSKGNTWVKLSSVAVATTPQTVEIWWAAVTVALTTADTITLTRTPTGGILWTAQAIHTADTTTPFGTPVGTVATGTSAPSGPAVTVPPGGLAIMAFSFQTNVNITSLNAGWTDVYSAKSTGTGNPRGLQVAVATATATPGATTSVGGYWAMLTVPVNVAASGPIERTATGTLTLSGLGVSEVAPPDPVDARVAIIGDSLTYRSGITASPPSRETITRARFVTAGFDDAHLYWHGVGGKGLVASDTSGKTTMQNITDAVTALGGVDVWVIALGTNNTGDSDATFNTNMGTVLSAIAAAGGGTILWVNLGYWSPVNTNAVHFNPLIASAVTGADGTVLDFNTRMGDPRTAGDWIYPTDSTHLTPQGSEVRDWFIIDGVLAALRESLVRTAAGVMTLAGTAGVVVTMTRTASGTVALAGTAARAVEVSRTASGTVTLAGATVTAVTTARTAVGTVALAGDATRTVVLTRTATGMFALTGAADTGTGPVVRTAEGTLAVAGTATRDITVMRLATATLTLTGVAVFETGVIERTATGTLTIGGTATRTITTTRAATGTLTLHGTAPAGGIITRTALGTLVLILSAAAKIPGTSTAYLGDIPVTLMLDGQPVTLA